MLHPCYSTCDLLLIANNVPRVLQRFATRIINDGMGSMLGSGEAMNPGPA
jgi:hypothetical protein